MVPSMDLPITASPVDATMDARRAAASSASRREARLGHLLADHVFTPVPEHGLCRRVELGDATRRVHGHDRVEGGFHDRALACLAVPERILGLLALGELADLAPDRPHHGHQVL